MQILLNFHPKVDFASEQDIRDAIRKRYYFEELIYHDTWAMTEALQNRADLIADYYNKLFKTTLYEYDPTGNVDLLEDHNETNSGTGSVNSNVHTLSNEFPMGEPINTPRPVQSSSNGSDSFSNTNANRNYKNKKSGLNGLKTKQELIEEERRIILSILPKYVEEFTNLFLVTI